MYFYECVFLVWLFVSMYYLTIIDSLIIFCVCEATYVSKMAAYCCFSICQKNWSESGILLMDKFIRVHSWRDKLIIVCTWRENHYLRDTSHRWRTTCHESLVTSRLTCCWNYGKWCSRETPTFTFTNRLVFYVGVVSNLF